MKTTPARSTTDRTRTPARVRDLAPRVAAYSATATATAALAIAPAAAGQTITRLTQYSVDGVSFTAFAAGSPVEIDLTDTTDGSFPMHIATQEGAIRADFRFIGGVVGGSNAHMVLYGFPISGPLAGGAAAGTNHNPGAFGPGEAIEHLFEAGTAIGGNRQLAYRIRSSVYSGNWIASANQASKTAYLAFKSAGYYGWLHLKVVFAIDGHSAAVSLLPNTNGIFGAVVSTSDPDAALFKTGQDALAAVPEPASVAGGLALLALGAAGVRELRRRRKRVD